MRPQVVGGVRQKRPGREEAEEAVRVLIAYAGDAPSREGLLDTPSRVVKAMEEFYGGYAVDPAEILSRTFSEKGSYDDIVLVKDIPFTSHCEHHMIPFHGQVHIGYIPDGRIVGLSKFARVVDAFARRLQTQERLTSEVADCINSVLAPRGVAVMIEAEHLCMSMRGIKKSGSSTITLHFSGELGNEAARSRFMDMCGKKAW